MSSRPLVLSDYPTDVVSRRLALGVGLISLALFLALVPFATQQFAPAHWFVPVNQSILIINDLVTAALLFGQMRLTRKPAIVVLASAYAFSAGMAVIHLLTFPGVFAATGLLGAGTQSTAYLYIFWHIGFALMFMAYSIVERRNSVVHASTKTVTTVALLAATIVMTGLATLAISGAGFLPPVLDGRHYSPGFNAWRYGQWVITAIAFAVLWRHRSRSVLDTWLLVVLAALFFEIGLVAVFNAGRYDLGFYSGRIYAVLASSFVLLVLLTEQGKLYRDLVEAQETARSEGDLRRSREVLKLAMEGARLGVWSLDLETAVAWWSPELEQLMGLPVGGLPARAQAFQERVHPEDLATVDQAIRQAIATRSEFAVEFRLLHASGSWTWMVARGKSAQGANGRATSLFGVVVDITARKLADEAEARLEARFQTLADGMPQLAWMARPDGWIYWYNRRWYEHTGTTPQEMEGWGWQKVHDPELLPEVLAQWRRSIETGEPFEMVFPLRRADGRFGTYLTRVSPLKNEEGEVQHWFGTNTDITDQRHAEEALRKANRRKDEFLATLAHELRNPLAPIRNCVEILNRASSLPPAATRARDVIDRQSKHLSRLVDDLLEVSRINEGKVFLRRERASVATCLRDAVDAVKGSIESADHRLVVDIGDDPLYANVDVTRVTQAFMNLLINAAKFTPRGGTIVVRAAREGDSACIRIADTGIGIEAAQLPQIFEMFAQVEPALQREQGGLGIGLALVRGFIGLHGGTVQAFSEGLGHGSEFVVSLPLEKGHATTSAVSTHERSDSIAPRKKRVLVVDDNHDATASLAALLEMAGHEVRQANSGRDSLDVAAAFQPDVVVLDIGMPGMSGLEVARELRSRPSRTNMQLIAVTGWGQEADRTRTREAGFDAHLTKPIDFLDLQMMLATGRSESRP